jgi:hypothetical protein
MHLPALLPLVAVAAALACGCATSPPPPPATATATTASPPLPAPLSLIAPGRTPFLAMDELRGLQGGKPHFILYRNGLLERKGEPLGTLHPDGRFLDLDNHLLVTMGPNGTFAIDDGVITIVEDGTATLRTRFETTTLRFDEAGRIIGGGPESQVQGLTPALRRTAMFALLLTDIVNSMRHRLVH